MLLWRWRPPGRAAWRSDHANNAFRCRVRSESGASLARVSPPRCCGPRPWRPRRRRATWYASHSPSASTSLSSLPLPPPLPSPRPPAPRCPRSAAHAQRVIRVLALTPPTSGRGQMKKSPGMLKMWQRRWFVLDGGVVTYYKNHAEVSAPLCPSSRRGLAALSQRPAACRPVCRWGSAS